MIWDTTVARAQRQLQEYRLPRRMLVPFHCFLVVVAGLGIMRFLRTRPGGVCALCGSVLAELRIGELSHPSEYQLGIRKQTLFMTYKLELPCQPPFDCVRQIHYTASQGSLQRCYKWVNSFGPLDMRLTRSAIIKLQLRVSGALPHWGQPGFVATVLQFASFSTVPRC
jgi:hypothetical protein